MEKSADIRLRLGRLLETARLRPTVAAAGAELLARLDAPVRVSLFGLPGSGRTRLMNLLAGAPLLPGRLALPTTRLGHGETMGCRAILPDGSSRSWAGLPFDEIAAAAPLMIEIDAQAPTLLGFSLLRVAADPSPQDQLAAMGWAETQTDIALWCSQAYTPEEAAIWSAAPESLQDHGYLVMTGESRDGATPPGFRRSFHLLPGATGTGALGEALRMAAEQGRRGYADHALLFLSRYESAVPPRAATSPEVVAAPDPAPQVAPRAESSPASAPRPTREAPREAAPAVTDPARELAGICGDAAALLRDRARELSRLLPDFGPKPAPQVFGHCIATVQELADRITAVDTPELQDLVFDAADAITLLQGEGGTAQAADSVTLLLQLRREFEGRIAA